MMLALFLLFRALNNEAWRGTLLFWFVSLYGIGRAATDVFRGDLERHTYIGPITLTQFVCLTSATASLIVLIIIKRWINHNEKRLLSDIMEESHQEAEQ